MKTTDLDKTNHAPLHVRRSIILGCGGMGTEAVIHFKRVLTEHFDSGDFRAVQVLCFDTAQPDYKSSDDGQYLGITERIRVHTEDLASLVTDFRASPRIDAWFPESQREQAKRIAAEIGHSVQGAASTRPFGRIGFFVHYDAVEGDLRQLVNIVSQEELLTHDGEAVTMEGDSGAIYVVASLGGGTGTGIFMDVAAIAHKVLTDLGKRTWEVHAVLVLPEILVRDPKVAPAYTPQIMANSYAALKELDHFLHGNEFIAEYGEGEASRVVLDGEHRKLFKMVYLVDAENSADKSFGDRDQIATVIGQTLFHLTCTEVGRNFEKRLPDEQARLFYLRELPEPIRADEVAGRVRERRRCLYSSFGLSTLRIPVRALLDYCAAQRALAVAELVGRDGSENAEQVADRARELFDGGSGEQSLLSRLGLSSLQLDQALSLRRHIEPLPDSAAILKDEDPAARLRQILDGIRWTDDRERVWNERARESARKLRTRYIEGEVRVSKDKSPERIPPRLAQLVDEISRDEGSAVADLLLDHLEQGLVEIRELTLQNLADLKSTLGLDGVVDGESTHIRRLNALITDIGERQARRGFFTRGLFLPKRNAKRVGAWITDAIDLLGNLQTRYVNIAVLAEKAAICGELIDEINRLDDEVLPYRIQNFKFMKSQLRAQRNNALARCLKSTPPVHEVSPDPQRFYQDHYLPMIGAAEFPLTVAQNIRDHGLAIEGGSTLGVEEWSERPTEIIDALLCRCRRATALADDVIPTQRASGGSSLWKLDFDSHLFADPLPGSGSSDFQRFASMLRDYAEPYVTYDSNDTPSLAWSVLISGSCSDAGGRHWSRYIRSNGNQGFYPGLPNQVTLLMMRKAFPLFKLTRIKEWKRHYDDLMSEGWPLHVFKDAVDWQEPFISPQDDCVCPAEELSHLAMTHGVLATDETGSIVYRHPRREIGALFRDRDGAPKALLLAEFNQLIESHRILAGEILEDVAEAIFEAQGRDLARNPERIGGYHPCVASALRDLLGLS